MGHHALALHVAAAVDAALTGRVLLIGSPLPHGRDLDLLAGPPQWEEVTEWCAAAGLLPSGRRWAALGADGAYAVDLERADRRRWGGRDPSVLFADAEPLEGYRHLARPVPAAALVVAARGVVGRRGLLPDGARARVGHALERDPQAWAAADELAGVLGLRGALRALRAAYEVPSASVPARASRMVRYLLGPDPLRVKAALARTALPHRLHPTVVSLSGLDGSGKSTQAHRLEEALEQLGVSSAGQWAGFATSRKLYAAWTLLDRRAWTPAGRRRLGTEPRDPFVPPSCRTGSVTAHLWVGLAAVFNAGKLWWLVLRPRNRPEVLLFDRFSPDTAVKLDYFFGLERRLDVRWQRVLFGLLAPKPSAGFLLAVPGEVSHARRQEHWGPEQLGLMARLYDEHAPRFGLRRLDGRRPADDLHLSILRDVWRAL